MYIILFPHLKATIFGEKWLEIQLRDFYLIQYTNKKHIMTFFNIMTFFSDPKAILQPQYYILYIDK